MPKTATPPRTTRGASRGRGKAGARRPVTRPRRQLPILPLVTAGVFLVVLVALVIAYRVASGPGGGVHGQPIANIECNTGEQLSTHYHAHLSISYQGTPVPLTAQTGITDTCLYWLHTHDGSGVIHIEAPKQTASRQFTLGDFFRIWDQPLSTRQVATLKVGSGQQLKVWVDGKPYSGDPSRIVLRSKEDIVIEIGPPFNDPPTPYVWDNAQYPR